MIVAQRKQASLIFIGGMLHTRSKSRKQRYKVDIHLPSCQKMHSGNALAFERYNTELSSLQTHQHSAPSSTLIEQLVVNEGQLLCSET